MYRLPAAAALPRRPGVVLLVILAFLTLFAIVGITFVLQASAEASAARSAVEAYSQELPDVDPELLFAQFLGQLIYDLPDDERGIFSCLRGQSLARNMYGLNYEIDPRDGSIVLGANDVPFNGTGRLYSASPFADIDDYQLINYTYFAGDGFLRDPERVKTRTGPRDPRQEFRGGFNAPYTYPDLNNLYLAAVRAGPVTMPSGRRTPAGTVLIPSFYRPWVFHHSRMPAGIGPLDRSNPHWTSPEGKYLLLRPRPIDIGPGFPYPEDEGGDVKNLIGGPGYYDPYTGKIYQNDSMWLDLDAPVLVARDGRKYKPLFAPLIVDLDNRINVNVHGNVRGLGGAAHASNMGWGPWEVNPALILDDRFEWPQLFRGSTMGGRYGLGPNARPQSPTSGNLLPPLTLGRFYAPSDLDGSRELSAGAPTDQRRMPGTPPSLPFHTFPAVPLGYGNASLAERADHPGLYNVGRPEPPNRNFGLSNIEALLRAGDTGAPALAGDLLHLCPRNLLDPWFGAKRRGMLTVHSADISQPGVTPWFWPAGRPIYNRLPPQPPLQATSAAPSGSALGTPPNPLPALPESEFGLDGRAAAAITSLGRLDLNRYLPAYPNPSSNGRIIDLRGFAVAQTARQYMAAEIYERLWRLTGAGDPSLPGTLLPPSSFGHEPGRWQCFRWLAQLAVNIVDFIDADDYMTPFTWYTSPRLSEWVYGTELPRVVINEAYVEYANDPADPGLSMNPPQALRLKANTWVELFNTFQHDPPLTAPYRSGTAQLEIPPSAPGANDGYGAYRLIIARLTTDLRQLDNVQGDVLAGSGKPLNAVSSFTPLPGAGSLPGVDTRVIQPADFRNAFGYAGREGANEGFYVLGPLLDAAAGEISPFPTAAGSPPMETLRRPEMSYLIPAQSPLTGLPRPGFVLQRLTCPHLPPNPPPGGTLNPALPLNVYVTVDYVRAVEPNYAAAVGVQVDRMVSTPFSPQPVPSRISRGRRQPYAAATSEQRTQQPTPPLPNQPQHSFFQHNVDALTPGPNWRVPPNGYPPFDWLVHLDRPLVSVAELLHVSGWKPHELTQEFINPTGALRPFNHRVPWLDEDMPVNSSPPQSHRLYRALEFFETRNHALGVPPPFTVSLGPLTTPGSNCVVTTAALVGLTPTGGIWQITPGSTLIIDRGLSTEEVVRVKSVIPGRPARFVADFLMQHADDFTIAPTIIRDRTPGKVNLNTVWDEEVFQAVCDAQPSNRFTGGRTGDVAQIWSQLKNSRTISGESPGRDDRPFLSLATGPVFPADTQFPGAGLRDTLLRSGSAGPILAMPGAIHPYQTYELLTKIFGNVTVRSNVFAVWLTVGFFEVVDDTTRPVKLGPEMGRAEGRHIRHRMFGVIDRSVLLGNPGPQPGFDPRAARSPGAMAGRVVPYLSIIE